jgi:predicted transcriptional regulator
MTTLTVRVRPQTYRALQEVAREHDESLPAALDRIVEERRRLRMFQAAHEAYAAIAADPIENALWQEEMAAWDATLLDGLEPEPELANEP